MFDFRPIDRQVKIGIIRFFVTLHASHRRRHKAVAFTRIVGVVATGPVTFLALYVSELGSRIHGLESASLITNYVAADAFVIKLLVLLFECSHRVRVPGVGQYLILFFMASRAGLDACVMRVTPQ